jgi:tryptophan 2,3-dioxygenase
MKDSPSVPRSEDGPTYGEYLKVPELLSLQVTLSDPPHHDELLFIIIHQAYELWFKLILHEMEKTRESMREGKVLRANHFMKRVLEIMKLLVSQIHLLETMTPAEFLQFRDKLNPASGFQSVQFREIEFLAGLKNPRFIKAFAAQPHQAERLQRRLDEPSLNETYFQLLRDRGYPLPESLPRQVVAEIDGLEGPDAEAERQVMAALITIYQNPDGNLPLYLLSETCVEFDLQLDLWREHHVRVVERSIGFKRGTGGSQGVAYLRSTTGRKCFPYLWDVRSYLKKGTEVW